MLTNKKSVNIRYNNVIDNFKKVKDKEYIKIIVTSKIISLKKRVISDCVNYRDNNKFDG
jgi:hypothetical protein